MATGKLGMNPEEVQQLAGEFDRTANEIGSLINTITQRLGNTTWEGNDRNQFESTWQSESCRQLNQVQTLLNAYSDKARRNAQDQVATSSNL